MPPLPSRLPLFSIAAVKSDAVRWVRLAGLGAVAVGLVALFPRLHLYLELLARDLRDRWWAFLLLALGSWLLVGWTRRR